MTRQESFKRRVRARMSKTGEKYGAARRALIEQANTDQAWVSRPHLADERVVEATGRSWEEWRRLLDRWGGREKGHADIVAHLVGTHRVDGWWAQTVTVGYERITGLRLPNQGRDGTFTATKTRTMTVDAGMLREMLLDPGDRSDLFPGVDTDLRSRPGSKTIRLGIGPGVAQIALDPLSDGRVRVSVSHERVSSPEEIQVWKAYWSDWLEAVDNGMSG